MDKIRTSDSAGDLNSGRILADQQQIAKAKSLANQGLKTEKELEKASGGFEALMLHEMLKTMWSTVQTTGLLGEDSNEAQIYRDMFNQAVADSISEGKGVGIKQFLKKELKKADGIVG